MSATTSPIVETPEAAPTNSGRRLTGADGVRAFAALSVLLYHLFQRLSPVQVPWLRTTQLVIMKGCFGVSIFFVLSGLLLATPFWRAHLTGRPMPRIGAYARRRVARIAPGFYASLLVCFALSLVFLPDTQYRVIRLISGLTFTSGFHWVTFTPVPGQINGPLWSIGFEVVSYVLLPLAMWGMFRLHRRGTRIALGYWIAVFVVAIAVNQWIITNLVPSAVGRGWQYGDLGGAKEWMPSYNPIGFFGHFAIGIAAAAAITWWQLNRGGRRHWGFDALAASAIAVGAALVWTHREPAEPVYWDNFQGQPYLFPWFALTTALLLIGLAHSRVLGGILDNRFARYTAKVSFGIYIWHYPLIFLTSVVTDNEFEYYGIFNPWRHLFLAAVVVALTYAVASASWFWLEKPILNSRWANGGRLRGEARPEPRTAETGVAGTEASANLSPGD